MLPLPLLPADGIVTLLAATVAPDTLLELPAKGVGGAGGVEYKFFNRFVSSNLESPPEFVDEEEDGGAAAAGALTPSAASSSEEFPPPINKSSMRAIVQYYLPDAARATSKTAFFWC